MKTCLETIKNQRSSYKKKIVRRFTFQNKIWSSEQYYDLDISLL